MGWRDLCVCVCDAHGRVVASYMYLYSTTRSVSELRLMFNVHGLSLSLRGSHLSSMSVARARVYAHTQTSIKSTREHRVHIRRTAPTTAHSHSHCAPVATSDKQQHNKTVGRSAAAVVTTVQRTNERQLNGRRRWWWWIRALCCVVVAEHCIQIYRSIYPLRLYIHNCERSSIISR